MDMRDKIIEIMKENWRLPKLNESMNDFFNPIADAIMEVLNKIAFPEAFSEPPEWEKRTPFQRRSLNLQSGRRGLMESLGKLTIGT